jgi:hypothetical protein
MPRKVARLNRAWPTIVIVNHSDNVAGARLRLAVRAIQKQIDRDFFPVWGWRAKLRLRTKASKGLMSVVLRNRDRSESGDEGYHVDDNGIPSAVVFTHGNGGDDQEVFATLSHEVLEMIADPSLNLYASTYRKFRGRYHRAFVGIEVCDPVEDCLYKIDGIKVSDFVVPEWFESERKAGSLKFSFKGNVRAPLQLAKGGYMDVVINNRLSQHGGAKDKVRHRLLERQRLLEGKPVARRRKTPMPP